MDNDTKILDAYSKALASTSLEIGAIKLRPEDPFQWASGYRMPIYNDNRMLLGNYEHRKLVKDIFSKIISSDHFMSTADIIAGTSTAGIPPATTLADALHKPLIYIREKPKDHGLKNQIEGISDNSDLEGKTVILIEDLISTGGSSVKAVQAIRNAKGDIDTCLSIFNYGFKKAADMFAGTAPYNDTGEKLTQPCEVISAVPFEILLQAIKETKYLNNKNIELIEDWYADPFNWGAKHGFPKVEKK